MDQTLDYLRSDTPVAGIVAEMNMPTTVYPVNEQKQRNQQTSMQVFDHSKGTMTLSQVNQHAMQGDMVQRDFGKLASVQANFLSQIVQAQATVTEEYERNVGAQQQLMVALSQLQDRKSGRDKRNFRLKTLIELEECITHEPNVMIIHVHVLDSCGLLYEDTDDPQDGVALFFQDNNITEVSLEYQDRKMLSDRGCEPRDYKRFVLKEGTEIFVLLNDYRKKLGLIN